MCRDAGEITLLLHQLGGDDGTAASKLLPLVYDELRALAGHFIGQEQPGHTLQPTALVHEVYLRLVGSPNPGWTGREHFMAVCAKAIRHVLADHARRRRAAKRGAGWRRVTLDGVADASQRWNVDALDLDEALSALEKEDPRKAQVVTLRFFGGLTMEDVSQVLGVSRMTVTNDWTFARAWLLDRLSDLDDR